VQGDYASAQAFQEQALEIQRLVNDETGICRSLESLAILAGTQDNYARAGELLEEVLALRRKLGNPKNILSTLNNLAIVAQHLGQLDRAEALYREKVELCQASNDERSLGHALHGLGELRMARADYASALAFFRQSVEIRHRLGHLPDLSNSLVMTAIVLHRLGKPITAVQLISASDKLRRETGAAPIPATQAEIENSLNQMRTQIDIAAFEQVWADGQRLSVDEAVALVPDIAK
jgi:tetratricopeptide (TPR) repeat protein